MNVVAGLILLLVKVHLSALSRSCQIEGSVSFCVEIPSAFSPGISSLVMSLRDVGEINSTVLHSDDLASVTRLRIESAGVTGIAEGAFGSFQNLIDVSLNQNLLTEINPKWFGRPSVLSEFNIIGNQIEVLNESMLDGLFNLTKLRLSENKIRAIDPGTFSSQTVLAELDLSGNRMSRVSPQVFRSLRSTRISLHGNPWDCSCGAEDFVDFLKDLHSRSLLDRPMNVTCESPPTLNGLPVLNVSVCLTSPPPRSPDAFTTVPASSAQLTPGTSVQPKPTDILTMASTPPLKTASFVTSPPSVTEISLHPKPSDLPLSTSTPTAETEICGTSRPSSGSTIVCTLVIVIVVLSLLLFVVCFLVVLYRRKRSNKTVMPGGPKENELKDDGSSRSSHAHYSEDSKKGENTENNRWDLEIGRRRSFAEVRAKSANAILFTSSFGAPAKDQVTLQAEVEAQLNNTKKEAVAEQNLGSRVDGRTETESSTNANVNAKEAADGRNPDKDPLCVSVNTDAVPYLSIGTNQNKPNPDDFNKQSNDAAGRRSHRGKAMGRISTWPPTAVQWQARSKMKEGEEEEGSDVFASWTLKFPGELKNVLNKVEHPSNSDQDNKKEDETEKNQTEEPLKTNPLKLGQSHPSKTNDKTTSLSEAHTETQLKSGDKTQDPVTERQKIRETQSLNQDKHKQDQLLKPAEKSSSRSSNKAEQRNEPKRAVASRQRADNRSSGSRAPSGGASPDDETLLSGNEYAFMDLLHEVVQNNGRWTRERWRQIHINKQQQQQQQQQRRQDRGTEGV